jgi:hypothetical protein
MKKLIIVLALLVFAVAASAQEALTPNTPVEGEIAEDALEVLYTFSGTKGTPYIIEMRSPDPLSGLSEPALALVGPDGSIVANTDSMFQTLGGYGAAYIGVVLPADGDYTVTATRTSTGTSVGPYSITLIEPTVLEPDTTFTGELSSEGSFDFYVYNPKERFYINFWRTDGDFVPELSVNAISEEDGSLMGLGYAYGENSNYHALGFFDPDQTYFVLVGQPEAVLGGGFYFEEETAEYELEIGFPIDNE